jgi:protocatechuate 3,4-dioxygenase beta subunit
MQRHLWAFPAVAAVLCFASLSSFGAITGTIMTSDGQPIAGARVSIRTFESKEAARTRLLSPAPEQVPLTTVQTDAKGAFSLASPKEPVVTLSVSAPGYEPLQRRIESADEAGALALRKAPIRKGTVTAGGKPVAQATVVLYFDDAEYLTKTDEQGRYEAPDPKHADRIIAVHPDFAVDQKVFFGEGNVAASVLQRTLSPGRELKGRVTTGDADTPVAKATVFVDGWPLATTGDDGAFTIAHAPAKWTSMLVRKDALIAQRPWSNEAVQTIRVAKGATISGRITDSKTKLPVPGVIVDFGRRRFGPDSPTSVEIQTDAKGAYSAVVPTGTYSLFATHPGYELNPADTSATAPQSTSKDLTLSPLGRVSGVVLDEGRKPVTAAAVTSENAELRMMRGPMRFLNESVVSGPDGRFSMRVPPDTEIFVEANKRGLPKAKSDAFSVEAGERKSGLVLTIANGIAVAGRVTDGEDKPLSGVAVTAAEAEGGGRGGMMMRTFIAGMEQRDDNAVTTATDGTYTIRVKEGTYDFSFRRDGFAPKTVRGQAISVAAAPTVDASLEPAVEIAGRVTRNGAGLENVRILALGGGLDSSVVTAADGSFTLSGLAAGPVRLMAMKEDDFVRETRNVTAPARDVVIDLKPGGRITGRVVERGSSKPVTTFRAGISTSRGGGGMVMMAPPQLQDFTSEDGSFTLENVPAGAVVLVANAPGYAAGRMNLNVEAGKSISDVELELDAGVRLVGRVTSATGSPLGDVQVRVRPSPTGGFAMNGMEQQTTTDANGDYVLEALTAGEETISFSHAKHPQSTKSVELKGRETRLDVQLSAGQRVSGMVVTDSGAAVPDAEVTASSGSTYATARTNANGAFEMESLPAGRHRFSAEKRGYADGFVDDVDVSDGAPVRIVLHTGGTITGRITGLTAEELAITQVSVRGGQASAEGVPASNGSYRVDGVPAGSVQVRAVVASRVMGGSKTSTPQTVEMPSGGSQQVDITFRTDIVIRGRVTRDGAPVGSASISFYPAGGGNRSTASALTDEQGQYSVTSLEEGEYNVRLVDMQRMAPYSTTYQVRGSNTFDIDYRTTSIHGRVVDATNQEPLPNVAVQLRASGSSSGPQMARGAVTDSAGAFILDSVSPGNYTITAKREGFGTWIRDVPVTDSGTEDLDVRLAREDVVTLNIVDARDGRPISARAFVYDMQGRVMEEPRFGGGDDSSGLSVTLSPGTYIASITANGYAGRNVTFRAPSTQTVALSRGGTLLIRSKHSEALRVMLRDAAGIPYLRMSTSTGSRELPPTPATTMYEVAAGTYTIQLLGAGEVVLESKQVTVGEGQTVNEEI